MESERKRTGLLAVLLLGLVVVLTGIGCDEDGDDLDGRFPPPDSGDTAVITLEHRQYESGREALSYGKVQVLLGGSPSLDATVTLDGNSLPYDGREQAFYDQILPVFVPGTSYKVRVRSGSWGEDSTFAYLPGDFTLSPSRLTVEWAPGMEYDFDWEESYRAHRFIVRINIVDAADALVQDTLAADVFEYAWTIPEAAGGQNIKVRVAAERTVNDPPVWSGKCQTYSDFEFHVQP